MIWALLIIFLGIGLLIVVHVGQWWRFHNLPGWPSDTNEYEVQCFFEGRLPEGWRRDGDGVAQRINDDRS